MAYNKAAKLCHILHVQKSHQRHLYSQRQQFPYLFLKLIAVAAIYLILSAKVFSQPQTEWVSTFNSGNGQNDIVTDMKMSPDGFIYLCGYIEYPSAPLSSLLLKYNSSGNLVWSKIWKGRGQDINSNDVKKILFDKEGFVYVMGNISLSGSLPDYLLIKFDQNGDTVWSRVIDGEYHDHDDALDMAIDDNNNIYITGKSYFKGGQDNTTFKIDAYGNLKWLRKFDFSGNAILLDSFYAFVAGGKYISPGNVADVLILKYDTAGFLNDSIYCGNPNRLDGAQLIIKDKSHDLIFSGTEDGAIPTQGNIITGKISQTGKKYWFEIFDNNSDHAPEYLMDLTADQTGNIFMLSRSRNQQLQRSDIALVKYSNATGDSIWTRKFNLVPFSSEDPAKMSVDDQGSSYIVGTTDSSVIFDRIVTVKFDSSGSLLWHKVYYPTLFSNSIGKCVCLDGNSNIYVSGITSGQSDSNIVLIKYSQMTSIGSADPVYRSFQLHQNFPNPFNSQTRISFDIFKEGHYVLEIVDMLGRTVEVLFDQNRAQGHYNQNYESKRLSSGIYFLKLSSSTNSAVRKFLVLN